MAKIELLGEETINKIAAGEVVERPASVVKELVENAIDAGATSITVEIKEGGISFIRVTDNGEGIEKNQIRKAFCRHATSKLRTVEDLDTLLSLGFRGEALSSICAVAYVELITKTKNDLVGSKYVVEGAQEKELSEIGVPSGTTIIVRNLFFNTPARRKFLKSTNTEGGYVSDVCEHLALSRPDISFKFVMNNNLKFNTSGDGDLKEVIYRIYGKDVAASMIKFNQEGKDIRLDGYLGKPVLNRSNRNFEKFFINGRYIKSNKLSLAVEAGYKAYLMQHKYPFVILNMTVNTNTIDVNVHPTKMEIRFDKEEYVCDYLESSIHSALKVHEMIPEALLDEPIVQKDEPIKIKGPEPFENVRKYEFENKIRVFEKSNYIVQGNPESVKSKIYAKIIGTNEDDVVSDTNNLYKKSETVIVNAPVQMDMFEEKLLSKNVIDEYKIIGQVFDTYWIFTYQDKMILMDQHAAHEKVKYEKIIKDLADKSVEKQQLSPPLVISLSGMEKTILQKYINNFSELGYEIDDFGKNEIAIRTVPLDLYGLDEKEVFLSVLDELAESGNFRGTPDVINDKIASMACKSAVKGNNRMTTDEVISLLEQLLTLDNPYNCPHGRPTLITMSKYELEKKFKRII